MAIREFRQRIEAVLQRSFDWVAWQRALEATFVDEYLSLPGSRLTYCVDTSLIIEFLLPRSLQVTSGDPDETGADPNPRGYPRPRDLALLLLFDPKKEIHILPPHRKEFDHKVQEWQRRLAIQRAKLELFQAALDRLLAVFDSADHLPGEGDRFQRFVDAVLNEASSFGGILALETQGARSVSAISERLRPVAQKSLSQLAKSADSRAGSHIDVLYKALARTSKGRDTSFNNRIDAHALYLLEKENHLLSEDSYLILLTESGKIWSFLSNDEQREATGFRNRRGKIWLVQTPEVELVSALVELLRREKGGEEEARRELILDLEQNRRLREIRDEIEHKILPKLDELANDEVLWDESEARVEEFESGLKKLKSVYRDRDRLRTLRLGMDTRENWGGTLFEKLRSLQTADQRELRMVLSSELGRLRDRVCELERQMLIASPPTPGEDALFDLIDESAPELQGVIRSQAEGTVYFIRFQSTRILTHLERIQELLGGVDKRRETRVSGSMAMDDQLQGAMRVAKMECRDEPEYNLLLAAIYASRGLWFDAYVAADQELGKLVASIKPGIEVELGQAQFEAHLIKAAALLNWTLARYGDLPELAAQFLKESSDCLHRAFSLSTSQDVPGLLGSRQDPRALRELATIYGCAREVGRFSFMSGKLEREEVLLEADPMDLQLAGLPESNERDLLMIFRALAQRAYDGASKVPSMRVYFVNTLLFALIEDDSEESEKMEELAGELRSLQLTENNTNFFDTLAWFHYSKARRAEAVGADFAKDLRFAEEYIRKAKRKLREGRTKNRYYRQLVGYHEKQIEELNLNPAQARGH